MIEKADLSAIECSSCSRLWHRIDSLEREIQKKDKKAAYQMLASGILFGVIVTNFIVRLSSMSW